MGLGQQAKADTGMEGVVGVGVGARTFAGPRQCGSGGMPGCMSGPWAWVLQLVDIGTGAWQEAAASTRDRPPAATTKGGVIG